MGRRTKYTDFINFEKQLFSNPDEELLEFLKVKNIRIEKYRDNLYLKFINDNKDKLGENWSNLEIMISQLADAILFFKENSKVLSECIGSDYYPYFNDVLEDTNNYTAKRYVAKVFEDEILDEELDNYKKELFIENLNELFLDQLDLLIELLEIYLSYLDYIDFEIRGIEARPTALDAIRYLSHTYVLNFNYTNTSGYLFGTSDMLTHFIHGRIDLERTFGRINTMVFGIEDKENDVNSDLIPYQKYFGHSVDPLDKEIFQKCFELAEKGEYLYRFIFTYYDESAKRSIIKNLAIILGKEKLIELTGKRNVVFIQSDDKDGMKDILLP